MLNVSCLDPVGAVVAHVIMSLGQVDPVSLIDALLNLTVAPVDAVTRGRISRVGAVSPHR